MQFKKLMVLSFRNIFREKVHFLFSSVGLVVGVGTLAFFTALGTGIREEVLNKIYPVNQFEVEPESFSFAGFRGSAPITIDDAMLQAIRDIQGVENVYPKERSKFQARLWGGKGIFGRDAHTEAFFDGIDPDLLKRELKEAELANRKEVKDTAVFSCESEEDCGPSEECDNGTCREILYYAQFRDLGEDRYCTHDNECMDQFKCLKNFCRIPCKNEEKQTCPDPYVCIDSVCYSRCLSEKDCQAGEECDSKAKVCKRLRCEYESPDSQFSDEIDVLKGNVLAENGMKRKCPEGTYCAGDGILSRFGSCESPIPVILNPVLIEIYNSIVGTALGLQKISGMEVMLGVEFNLLFGESYFVEDEKSGLRAKKRCRIVGFSSKAMEFGVTMPVSYVLRANSRFRGKAEAEHYNSVIVVTQKNEDVPAVTERLKEMGLVLSPRSEEGKKAADVIFILTVIFIMISLTILTISAINITHTFLMVIYERKKEIGVFRALGASMWDIRKIFLTESLFLGLFGGSSGLIVSYIFSRIVNAAIQSFLYRLPFRPDDIFAFTPAIILGGMGTAVLFSLVGAFIPADKAARTDPAVVLSSE
jgi:ABC-type antimicrobial peptide transport system permease subunit